VRTTCAPGALVRISCFRLSSFDPFLLPPLSMASVPSKARLPHTFYLHSTVTEPKLTMADVAMAPPPPEDKENQDKKKSSAYKSPWVEAYRPRTLADVLGNEETVSRLQAIAKDGNMPNLILCGPPGTGECEF